MDTDELGSGLNALTERIIGCAYAVANELGAGFLEKVYENALALELRKTGLNTRQQAGITVRYDGVPVGGYAADLMVEECVLVELKAARGIDEIHATQCLNYLKATCLEVCLLINFGRPRIQLKRFIHSP